MKVESVAISSLMPDPSNVRKHSPKNLAAIKGSLAKFGQQKPIVVGKNNIVIAGNGTLEAATALGWDSIDIVRTSLTGTEATAFAIADNRTGELAEWDAGGLSDTLKALQDMDFDLGSIGFEPDDLEAMIASSEEPTEGLTDPDEIPENVETRCKPGDLWILGNHRLLCGDSTNVQHVDRLMDGQKADICFTSPPYGQQRDYGVGKVSDWDDLMSGVFSILPMSEKGQILVNLGLIHRDNEWIPYWDNWLQFMSNNSWRRFGLYVWDQGSGLPGDWAGRLAPSFEFIFHFNRKSKKPEKTKEKKPENIAVRHGTGLRGKNGKTMKISSPEAGLQTHKIPDSVIRVTRHAARGIEMAHPAVFSVALAEEMLLAWPGIAYEPFLGSGSALIACEKTGRKCYGMEIDPHYCDVILKRWEDFTGKTAELSAVNAEGK